MLFRIDNMIKHPNLCNQIKKDCILQNDKY